MNTQILHFKVLLNNMEIKATIFDPVQDGVQYKKPLKLTRALRKHQKEEARFGKLNETSFDIFVKNVIKNEKLADMRVSKFVGRGASAVVFETPDGNILKLTCGNHFPLNRPVQNFDVPIYEKGKAGKVFYYIEEKLYQHNMGGGFVSEIKDRIKKEGFAPYDLSDYDDFQLGLSQEGKLYLIDPECARYKTIFHAIWDKLKRLCRYK